MNVTMIDNYDSFTYNLVQYMQELGLNVTTHRNDALTAREIVSEEPDMIVLSPGPSVPENSGVCPDLIRLAAAEKIPLLGVCLGHQAIAWVFGAKITRTVPPVHGKTSEIYHNSKGCFQGLPSPLTATRYHSLEVEQGSLPDFLEVSATTGDEKIMALKHRDTLMEGLQFHPESVLTKNGKDMIKNFVTQVQAMKPGVKP